MVYSSQVFAGLCARTLESLQAQQMVILDLRGVDSSPSDYFLICTANSDVHARALADTLVRTVDSAGFTRPRTEGRDVAEWILLDFFDVIVHIFRQESREYYKLEKLWGDAPIVTMSELQTTEKKARKKSNSAKPTTPRKTTRTKTDTEASPKLSTKKTTSRKSTTSTKATTTKRVAAVSEEDITMSPKSKRATPKKSRTP